MMDWRTDLENAPKDGSEILGWRKDCGVILMRWATPAEFMTEAEIDDSELEYLHEPDWFGADFISGYRVSNDGLPTHWYLPDPPK